MKENKKRIIFWFAVMVFFLILTIVGKNSFNQGFGTYGNIKKILDPVALEFNTSEKVTKIPDMRAEVTKDNLLITYVNGERKKEKYYFKFIDDNGMQYITNTDENNSTMWEFIVIQVVDAIYHVNGGTGSVFELYDIKAFSTTTLLEGFKYDGAGRVASINLNTNLVKNVLGKINSLKDDNYVRDSDLASLTTELNQKGFFRFNKDDINLYIKSVNKTYEIYVALTDENSVRAYKSIANVIKVLKSSIYASLIDSDDNVVFDSNSKYYQTITNAVFNEAGIFNTDDSIFEVILFK